MRSAVIAHAPTFRSPALSVPAAVGSGREVQGMPYRFGEAADLARATGPHCRVEVLRPAP